VERGGVIAFFPSDDVLLFLDQTPPPLIHQFLQEDSLLLTWFAADHLQSLVHGAVGRSPFLPFLCTF